jgi:hypothetical protein
MKLSDHKIVTAGNPKKVANAVMAYLNWLGAIRHSLPET